MSDMSGRTDLRCIFCNTALPPLSRHEAVQCAGCKIYWYLDDFGTWMPSNEKPVLPPPGQAIKPRNIQCWNCDAEAETMEVTIEGDQLFICPKCSSMYKPDEKHIAYTFLGVYKTDPRVEALRARWRRRSPTEHRPNPEPCASE